MAGDPGMHTDTYLNMVSSIDVTIAVGTLHNLWLFPAYFFIWLDIAILLHDWSGIGRIYPSALYFILLLFSSSKPPPPLAAADRVVQ